MVALVYDNKSTVNKSSHYSGQPTFIQILGLIPKHIVATCVTETAADFACKGFTTWAHLVTMIFSCCGHCDSLREVTTGMRALEGKLNNLGLDRFPARSTLSDANAKRDSDVFERIFFALKSHFERLFPDSRPNKRVYLVDSTTIKLFQEIFAGSGLSKENGKRKGGLKVHMAVPEDQSLPSFIHLSPGANNDGIFIPYLHFPKGSTVIMDMGYRNFSQFNKWTKDEITWVTRLHPHTSYLMDKRLKVNRKEKKEGVISDSIIIMGSDQSKAEKVPCRLIRFKSPENGKAFSFITNDIASKPSLVAAFYKKRWGIELLFKRLKQNMPLKYFLGDNQNAIKVQVWCALITDMLLQFLKRQVKRRWAYSTIVKVVRLHLFNYLDLISFLENPEKCVIRTPREATQMTLNLSG